MWIWLIKCSEQPAQVLNSMKCSPSGLSCLVVDESMQKLFEGGKGNVFQKVLSWIPSRNHQLQLAGALAIANFARNGKLLSITWFQFQMASYCYSENVWFSFFVLLSSQHSVIDLKRCSCVSSDGNCIHMVDTGIVQKLLELLDRHVEEGNVTVQHAALSALRNLAIPGEQQSA